MKTLQTLCYVHEAKETWQKQKIKRSKTTEMRSKKPRKTRNGNNTR
jgi:hypothetical protein